MAASRGAGIRVVRDPTEAVRGAHVISTDVFASMGQEAEQKQREAAFRGFIVSRDLLRSAVSDVTVLHCLPAHRGEEIEAEVIDASTSAVWDQAEARLHTAKAALAWALGGDD